MAPVLGALVSVAIGGIVFVFMHGETEQKAIAIAAAKTGPGYRYLVTQLSSVGDRGRANVIAYDDRTIKTVEVEW